MITISSGTCTQGAGTVLSQYAGDPIATLLYYGYLPRVGPTADDLPWAHFRRDSSVGEAEARSLVHRGVSTFRQGFRDLGGALHVLPLSGGLDSRAILGELLRHVDAERIVAVTVGTPGTFDYEIPVLIAREAGVRHERIDLNRVALKRANLEETSLQNSSPTWVFDAYYNRLIRERFGDGVLYWSGVVGGRLTSSEYLPKRSPATWSEAVLEFTRRNRSTVPDDLLKPGFDPTSVLPRSVIHPNSDLEPYEQLDLTLRRMCLIVPVNLPGGFRHRTPFLDPAWVRFILSVPAECRVGQALYKSMLLSEYPELFRLPTKNNVGLSLAPGGGDYLRHWIGRAYGGMVRRLSHVRPKSHINYIDFAQALRERADLQLLVRESLDRLVRHDLVPWIDCNALWLQHLKGVKDHTASLLQLTSLEIHMSVHGVEERV